MTDLYAAPTGRSALLVAAVLASAMGFIDGSVVAIALPAMRETLAASLTQATWFTNAYMLPLAACILVGGAMGDRFGVAQVFGGGIALYLAASIACAAAPSAEVLIAARVLQGLAAAAMIPGSLTLVSRAYPRAERGRAIGIWAAASALTTAAGPLLGGAVLGALGPEAWRLVFWINLPMGAVALWLLWRHATAGRRDAARRLDLPGAGLAIAALGLVALGLGGEAGGRPDWPLFAAGLLLLAVFIAWQLRARAPMVPPGLFAIRVFSAANLLSFAVYFALSAMLFFLPMTLIATWGLSELQTAASFVPLTLFVFALSSPMGRLADRIGPRLPIAAGSTVVALAFAAVALSAPWQAYWSATLPAMAAAGFGMALLVAPLSTAVMGAAPEDQAGAASGINNAVTRVAGLIAVAAAGALAESVYRGAGGTLSFAATGGDALHAQATNTAFQAIAGLSALLAGLGALAAWIGLRPAHP